MHITLNFIYGTYIFTKHTFNVSIVRIKVARSTIGSSEEGSYCGQEAERCDWEGSQEGTQGHAGHQTESVVLPICTHHVSGGLTHCLTLNLNSMREILKHVFNIKESNMWKTRVIELLTEAITQNTSNAWI